MYNGQRPTHFFPDDVRRFSYCQLLSRGPQTGRSPLTVTSARYSQARLSAEHILSGTTCPLLLTVGYLIPFCRSFPWARLWDNSSAQQLRGPAFAVPPCESFEPLSECSHSPSEQYPRRSQPHVERIPRFLAPSRQLVCSRRIGTTLGCRASPVARRVSDPFKTSTASRCHDASVARPGFSL
jgi:hypothetical protein